MDEDSENRAAQQLVARIKRTSKYYGQTKPGAWFDVRVVDDASYSLRGNGNNHAYPVASHAYLLWYPCNLSGCHPQRQAP